MTEPSPPGPDLLAGVRVIEVAGFVFAPIATAIMADLGADVVKVEPVTGDQLRGGRSGDADDDVALDGTGLLVELANRGKRSIALDLSHNDGRAVLHRLVEGADVFATSYLERVRQRLQIDVEHIQAVNPSIVYARGSGWGSSGPMRNAPAFDLVSAWAGSGMASMMADRAGEPPSMPIGIFDLQAGSTLAGAIGFALYRQAVTGLGAVVDTALLNVGMWAVQTEITALPIGVRPGRTDHDAPHNALVNWYRTADGRWLYLALVRSDGEWSDLVSALQRTEWLDDTRFATGAARSEHAAELASLLEAAFTEHPLDEWERRFRDFSGCWGVMHTPAELPTHRQVAPNGFIAPHQTIAGQHVPIVASPMHFDGLPTRPRGPAPPLGAHTDEVLREVGYDEASIRSLRARGVAGRA